MKRYIMLCTIGVLLSLGVTSFAAGIPYSISYDYYNNAIEVSGTSKENGTFVTLQILEKGYTFDEFDEEGDQSKVLWRGQATVKDGKYSIGIGYVSDTDCGEYAARLATNAFDEMTLIDNFMIVNNSEYCAAVNTVNKLAAENNFSEFSSYLSTDGYKLGYDFTLYTEVDNAARVYFEFVKDNPPEETETKQNILDFNTCVLIAGLNSKSVDNIDKYIENTVISGTELCEKYGEYISDENEQLYVTEKMSGKEIESFEQLETLLKQSIVLEEVYNATGYGDVREILSLYGAAVGISGTASNSVYKEMAGVDYSDADALKAGYERLKERLGQSGGNSNTSGGVGGSGSGGGSSNLTGRYTGTAAVAAPDKVTVYFYDIESVSWAREAIIALADKGIVNGKSEGYFKPDDNITREEFAKILVCAMGYSEEKAVSSNFADVNETDWFYNYVNVAYQKGILKGVGNGMFGTGQQITREDMMVMLYGALCEKNADVPEGELFFEDADMISDYAKDAVAALVEMGIVNGVSETEFDPNGSATRAQAAKVIYGALYMLQ